MKSYLTYFKLRVITELQYRASAIAGIFTQLFFGLVFVMVYLAFYESGSTSLPMSLQQLITYIWLQQAFYAIVNNNAMDSELFNMVKNGNLAYELLRPQNLFIKYFFKNVSKKIVATTLRCWPILIIGTLLPYPLHLSLPASITNFILFIIALALSCILISVLNVIINILTMYTIDERGFLGTYSVVCDLFMGGIVPLPFLPSFLKKISYILPFRYMSDLPFRVYSGSINISEGWTLIMCSTIWIIVLFGAGLLITKKATTKAVIQGG